jgi:murein DD-endopeptidase
MKSILLSAYILIFSGATLLAPPSPQQTGTQTLEGTWEGTLGAGSGKLHLVLTISTASGGAHAGQLNSKDQGAVLPMSEITVTSDAVRFTVKPVGGVYEGVLSKDSSEIRGTWIQTGVPPQPLSFQRVAQEAPSNSSAPATKNPPPQQESDREFIEPLDISIPVRPAPFKADGGWNLLYELHVRNWEDTDATITRLELVDANHKSLLSLSGQQLESMFYDTGKPNATTIGPRKFTFIFMSLAMSQRNELSPALRHRFTVKVGNPPEEVTVETLPELIDQDPVVVISPPLRGENWVAANGPSNTSFHRTSILPIDGRSCIPQRFAIDWIQINAEGNTHKGNPKDNKNYLAYGAEIHAVADGVVTEVQDGIPENIPDETARAVPMTLKTVGGNHVILDLGNGRYAVFAHMQPASVRVKMGDHVRRGQVLGLVGNSGNATEPHLHFHLCDANSVLSCEGLPYAFPSFESSGRWKADSKQATVKREMEIPVEGEIVRFPAEP